jgi:hypothetical protein
MEYWNVEIVERTCVLFFSVLHSAIETGGDLMLWIMAGPTMYHDGCMAALNPMWFRAKGTV